MAGPGASRRWYLSLLAGVLPVLVLGLAVSAAANRIIFVLWSFVAAALFAAVLRHGWVARWSAIRLGVACGLTMGLAAALFAALVWRHREIALLGSRALLPLSWQGAGVELGALHGAGAAVAFAAAVGGAVAGLRGREGGGDRRRPRRRDHE